MMTKGCMGLALVTQHDQVLGIITDGDVRRALDAYNENAYHLCAEQMMSAPPITIPANAKLEVAQQMMKSHQVTALVVLNDQDQCIGVLKLHDAR